MQCEKRRCGSGLFFTACGGGRIEQADVHVNTTRSREGSPATKGVAGSLQSLHLRKRQQEALRGQLALHPRRRIQALRLRHRSVAEVQRTRHVEAVWFLYSSQRTMDIVMNSVTRCLAQFPCRTSSHVSVTMLHGQNDHGTSLQSNKQCTRIQMVVVITVGTKRFLGCSADENRYRAAVPCHHR